METQVQRRLEEVFELGAMVGLDEVDAEIRRLRGKLATPAADAGFDGESLDRPWVRNATRLKPALLGMAGFTCLAQQIAAASRKLQIPLARRQTPRHVALSERSWVRLDRLPELLSLPLPAER